MQNNNNEKNKITNIKNIKQSIRINTIKNKNTNNIGAIKASILGSIIFSLSMSFSKTLSPNLSSFFIIFLRSLIGVPLSALLLYKANKLNKKNIFNQNLYPYIFRNLLLVLTMFCTYSGYRKLPLKIASSLGLLGPFFSFFLSMLFFKDKVTVKKVLSLIVGYIGVIILIKPNGDEIQSYYNLIYPLLANLLAAFIGVITKKMLIKNDKNVMMFFNNVTLMVITCIACFLNFNSQYIFNNFNINALIVCSLSLILSLALIVFLKYNDFHLRFTNKYILMLTTAVLAALFTNIFFKVTIDLKSWLMLSLIGCAGSLSQLQNLKAISYSSSPGAIAILEYIRPVIMTIIGLVFFHESFPCRYQITGLVIIIFSTIAFNKASKLKSH